MLTLGACTACAGTLRLLENSQLVPEMAMLPRLAMEPHGRVPVRVEGDGRGRRHFDDAAIESCRRV